MGAKDGEREPGRAMLGAVAGGLAHEIKNPLSTMTINLGLLREDLEAPVPDTARALRRVQVLEREGRRLEDIVQNFLLYAGNYEPTRRPVDLNATVAEVLDFVSPAAAARGIEVRRHLAPDLPAVPLDRDRFKQALLNLLLNAQEAMPGRGELLVQTARSGAAVRVDVTDTGPGIPPEIRPRIFEAFFSTKRKGTGLGLPLVKRVVEEEHDGAVEVWSDPGKGTRFTLWFPLAAPAAAPAGTAS